jgi:hypothetical protein
MSDYNADMLGGVVPQTELLGRVAAGEVSLRSDES